jgi:hypothetical protein
MKKSKEDTKLKARERRLYLTYGLTLEAYQNLLEQQDYKCAICKEDKTKTGKTKVLCVDHIHVRGFKKLEPEEKIKYVRGLLCFLCNTSIKFERSGMGRRMAEGMNRYFHKYKFKGEA